MKESKAPTAIRVSALAKPCEERHETAAEAAATVMQGLGKVSCDERGKHLQV